MSISIAIAGTTKRTVQCAQALLTDSDFSIDWILTPSPKPIGRKQVITPNPLDTFAKENSIPTTYIDKKITQDTQEKIKKFQQPDFLLVVDFGYLVPEWLLSLPKIAPVNIHPSDLPKWRGSSPGQFVLLYNEQESAVTTMIMDTQLDHGPVISKVPFSVNPNWTQTQYYKHAFNLAAPQLPSILKELRNTFESQGSLQDVTTPQPDLSPTPIARQLKKADTFVPWEIITHALKGTVTKNAGTLLSPLLLAAATHTGSIALTIERASKAFSPWPSVWTQVQTKSGETRMKLLELSVVKNTQNKAENNDKYILEIHKVHLAGKNPGSWEQVKTGIQTE